jgi:hypothetical protein
MIGKGGVLMGNAEDMGEMTEEIVSSYESRISAVCAIVDNTHRLLDDFREKRSAMLIRLKETLSTEKSFRENEFYSLMKDVLGFQEAIENKTRVLLNIYLDEQKEYDKTIREIFEKHSTFRIKKDTGKINDFRKIITDIQTRLRGLEELHDTELHDMLQTICRKHKMTVEFMQGFLFKETEGRATKALKITGKDKRVHSHGWWEVFKQTVSQWRDLNTVMSYKMAEERNNICRAANGSAPRLYFANIDF